MQSLLAGDDPQPLMTHCSGDDRGDVLLLGDHAGTLIPHALGDLGLAAADRRRHIAVDIGVDALGREVGARLGAPFLAQRYSRLVIDCNRDPASPAAVPGESDGTPVPGNAGLTTHARAARVAEVHRAYHDGIARAIDARAAAGRRTVLVALHSFTPRLHGGAARPWTVGVLHGGERMAARMLDALRDEVGQVVGDNEPYAFDGTDYTIPCHALARGLDWLELEVRQDLLGDAAGISQMAGVIARSIARAVT